MRTAQRITGLAVGGRALVPAALLVALAFLVFSSSAMAASQPAIEGDLASGVVPTDATLEATINPEGLPDGAYYQFQVVTNTSEYPPEIACPPRAELSKSTDGCMAPEIQSALPIGSVPDDKSVSLNLADAGVTLTPGTTYHYRTVAAKTLVSEDTLAWETPAVIGPDQTFTTPLASAPSIESESASLVTQADATLEAKINPEDLPEGAFYQFEIVKNPSEYLSELACPELSVQLDGNDGCAIPGPGGGQPTPGALPIGFIAKGSRSQSVSQSLADAGVTLQPGTTYHYRVLAVKKTQSEDTLDWNGPPVYGPDQTFITPETQSNTGGTSNISGTQSGTQSNTGGPQAPNPIASSATSGASNHHGAQTPKHAYTPKPPSNAQKLAKALAACKRKPKAKRATCEKQAHKKYGTPGKNSKG